MGLVKACGWCGGVTVIVASVNEWRVKCCLSSFMCAVNYWWRKKLCKLIVCTFYFVAFEGARVELWEGRR